MNAVNFDELKDADHMDEDTLRAVMERFGGDVWNYIYYLTSSPEQADGLAQEVFVKCYYRIGTYRGGSSFQTWLFSIARNAVFSYRKSRFFKASLWGDIASLPDRTEKIGVNAGGGMVVAASAEMQYFSSMHVNEIWDVIMKLPAGFREALVLDLKYGMSAKEIAELTGWSPGTVKSRLYRARRKVQSKLKEME
ncbi:RNA polymerase sigma factor [Paenibacillus rhizophilus]|nr:RNA polymerase sigma factor [Paenibacillus rhizophilus]